MGREEPALLGIDVGTRGIKAVISSASGKILGTGYVEYPLITLSPEMVEQDARLWWEGTCQAVRRSLLEAGCRGEKLLAVGVSSQGFSFVPIDSHGRELRNAITWLDSRAESEVGHVIRVLSEDSIIRRTGRRPLAACLLPLLLWLKRNEPEVLRNAAHFLMAMDYIIYRMTGVACTDPTLASGSLLMDIESREWMGEVLERFNVDPNCLPKILGSGTPVEQISARAREELGVAGRPIVVTGGQDQKCAAFAAGIAAQRATISLGTAAATTLLANRPLLDPKARIPCFPFVSDGEWVLEGVVGTAGAALEWARGLLGESDFSLLEEERENPASPSTRSAVNRPIFLPYLAGANSPHWQGEARGVFIGVSLATSRRDLLSAIVDGICYELRTNIEVTREIMGEGPCGISSPGGSSPPEEPAKDVAIFGGGSKSRYWVRTLGAVLKRPILRLLDPDLPGIGACLLAGRGIGLFGEMNMPWAPIPLAAELLMPDNREIEHHDRLYERYRRYRDAYLDAVACEERG